MVVVSEDKTLGTKVAGKNAVFINAVAQDDNPDLFHLLVILKLARQIIFQS